MGFLMTVGIMIATIAYLWKRRRKTEGGKIAVMLFALVALYPIIAGGSLEKIWLGYLATLLLSAPIPSRMFVNYAHQMPAGQRHEFYYISKGEQVCLLLQRHGISKGEQVCLLLQRHGISKGEQVCLLLQRHGISKGEQVCLLLQRHGISKGEQVWPSLQRHGISKGEQVCLLLQRHGISKGEQVWPSLQRHGIPKGEQVCLLLQPLCCGCFFSGVAGDGTVLLGPDGGVSTGTSRCPDRPDRDGVTAAGITVP